MLGPEYPFTPTRMNNLSRVLASQGKYRAAEETQRRVLELSEKVLAPMHPLTLTSMNNLPQALGCQDKYEAAEVMHQQVLDLFEKVRDRSIRQH